MNRLSRWAKSNRYSMKFIKTVLIGLGLFISFFMGGMVYMALLAPSPVCLTGQSKADLLFTQPEKSPLETSYIYMPGKGAHGNLMFEYAAGYCIAKKLDRSFIVSYRFKLLLSSLFHLSAPEPEQQSDGVNVTDFSVFTQRPKCCKYDERVTKLPRLDITLKGFFHSWLYFESCADDIRREFTLIDPLPKRANDFLLKAIKSFKWDPESVVFVGMHIRRGGRRPGLLPLTHGDAKPPPGYYAKAMNYYDKKFPRRNVMFVVASDDIRWARNNLDHPNIVISGDKTVDFHMAVLSKCNHSIISVGSISWWSAWLTGGSVVYYNGWPSPHSLISQKYTLNQYFYPRWVGMS
ncbi:galactoside 2-alpha-L-fucosyltransferase 1 [Lingula anatina]|uniref:L-Fucosyltransferase n=1 Tax=Lingula anatina TaxID=7574 RepID=A0A1S3HXZ8_LINAN|nr:galactoside 2-alpha-L-fucosyltransferase 1 [Lingula anatina]|eukprot:XP_013389949.1 galactoside 2-alpha-L-fucosyltransferase 1 [Lingula anatina]